jgi:hypothetical protein
VILRTHDFPGDIMKYKDKIIYQFGKDGKNGKNGLPGIKGNMGIPGIKGDQGLQGTQGIRGNQGIKGNQGQPGQDGLRLKTQHFDRDGEIEKDVGFVTVDSREGEIKIILFPSEIVKDRCWIMPIKDIGGVASEKNITIMPRDEMIDGYLKEIIISRNYAVVRLMVCDKGWFSV